MVIEIEQLSAHSPSPTSSLGRSDPFSRIISRCETLEEIAEQGQAGLRGLLGINDITEQTTQDLANGLGFLRNVELDIEGFERGGINFRPGLESCDHTRVMERVFGLTRDQPVSNKIRGGIVAKPTKSIDYTKVLEEVLTARALRENHILLDHIRESLAISQQVIKVVSEGGNYPDLELEKAYAIKFLREKSQAYSDLAQVAYQEALRQYHPEQSHSDE